MDIDRRNLLKAGVAAIGAMAEFGTGAAVAQAAGAIIYFNGTILTMEGHSGG